MFKNPSKKAPITRKGMEDSYQSRPSLMERLPWCDYNEKYKCFLLEDKISLGVCFKITPIACEARPLSMLEKMASAVNDAIKNALPCEKNNPWILQVYAEIQTDLSPVYQEIEKSFPENRKKTAVTQDFLKNIKEHLEYVSQPEGIFHDTQVTDRPFSGGLLQVYAVLYQRKHPAQAAPCERYPNLQKILHISRKFSDQLRACGIRTRRMRGQEFYDWMVKWFNPKKALLHPSSYPTNKQTPIEFDLAEQLFLSLPESFEKGWLFDGMPHQVLTIQSMTTRPAITAIKLRNNSLI